MKHINAIELEVLIRQQYSNITGLVILKGQQVVHEHYTGGYHKDSAVHVASVTKSVLSALIGIAIEQGAIHSIEQKVLDLFPRYRLKRGEKTIQKITIRHLLTMTSPYKYQSEPYTKVYSSDDWTIAALDLLGGKQNLEAFKYTTVGVQILAGVIANATNQSVRDFANKHLFKPLGINVSQDITINNKEVYFSFLKNNLVSGTVVDPKGINTAGWGLTLTAMDMAKFGQLYLNNGLWQGKKVLPSPWIKESIQKHSQWRNRPYGYLWWVIDEINGTYAAIGDSGNIIYVSSKKHLVIAIASQFMPRAKDRVDLITEHIEPLL